MKEGERILWLILVVTLKWPLKFFPLFMYLLSPPPPPLFLYPPRWWWSWRQWCHEQFLRHSEANIFSAACIDMPLPKWLIQ